MSVVKSFDGWSLDDLHQFCLVEGYSDATVERAEAWLDEHDSSDDEAVREAAVPAELLDAMHVSAQRAQAAKR